MFEPGDVVRFNYLWKWQAGKGEESGRKSRPSCVVVRTPTSPSVLYLFAITSQKPHRNRLSLAIPQMECRRAALAHPAWIILDEYNRTADDQAFDFESPHPIGRFSPAFLQTIAQTVKDAAAARRLSAVNR